MAINLNRENKFRVNEKRTLRLMRILHIKSVCGKAQKNYIKSTPAADVSIHVRFLYDEQVYRFIYKIDGAPYRNKPITPHKVANSLSQFVTLANR